MKTTKIMLAALAIGAMLIAPVVAQANCDEKASSCCSKKAKKASMTMKKECTDAAKTSSTSTTTTPAPVVKTDAPAGNQSSPK